jgi:hypothetical protein
MRRWVMALVLLAGMVSLSRADYAVIRIAFKQPDKAPMDKTEDPPAKGNAPKKSPNLKPSDYVQVVIEAKRSKSTVKEFGSYLFPFLETKWGKSCENFDGKEVSMQFIKSPKKKGETEGYLKTPLEQFKERHTGVQQGKDSDAYLKLASWCLEVGLVDKCEDVLGELEKMGPTKEAGAPPTVLQALAAYKLVKPVLTQALTKKDKAEAWKQKLNYSSMSIRLHYALLHNSQDPVRDGVERYLNDLEKNFKSFYLVFALKGKALPAPSEKLTVILPIEMEMFRKLYRAFDVPERITDGFHARQENLVVFAPERLDAASKRFDQNIKTINQSYGGVDLLAGKFRPLGKRPKLEFDMDQQAYQAAYEAYLEANNKKIQEDSRAQVLALVDTALREEAEMAAVTHEGTRQLIVATGLIPGNTAAPEWLRYAMASYFEMPKGPFLGTTDSETLVNFAFWPGAGGPHWAWRPYLDELIKNKKFPDVPTEELMTTLLGGWRAKPKEDGSIDEAAAESDLARSRCLAWALNYYLLNERFPEYMAFLTELGNLPRDIELDDFTFLSTFCQAFHVDTAGLTRTNPRGNLSSYTELAKAWEDSMRRFPGLTMRLKFEEVKTDKDPKDPKNKMPQ